ncbi:MAG TPA: SUMF1/EgtB/PvdO family nonheme iron enzyme, partial [Anaerolineales bacterium]|nr:SUMF1/EgtB/PvdO family nonheme iron enzyme [Anaerolineales bacterium]
EFTMGSDGGLPDEKPVQKLYLDTFYIDKYEVTNAFYRACVEAGACQPPKKVNLTARVGYFSKPDFDNYPVVNVDWNMARTYCEWRGAQLPTEAEWEKAARGTDGRTYPWGENISCEQANYFGCKGGPTSVSSYETGMSVYGVYDLAGNVYEWVSSLYMPYPYNQIDEREDLNASGERVIRGGSWINSNSDNEVRSARRQKADPATSTENLGFRCVRTSNDPALENILPTKTPQNGLTATAQIATSHVRRTKEPGIFISTPVPGMSITPTPGPTISIPITGPITEVPTQETQPATQDVQPPTQDVQPPTQDVQPPTQDVQPPTQDVQPPPPPTDVPVQ